MTSVCLYFKIHRPYTMMRFTVKDIDNNRCYEDRDADRANINRLADECCLVANQIVYEQIIRQRGKFKVNFSVSGVLLELLQRYRPDVIQSFKKLVSTGCVEFLAETYYHSLSALHSRAEFERQVSMHCELINDLFGMDPSVFRNTELIHNNDIAIAVGEMGLKGILCEGVERILQGRSRNRLYAAPSNDGTGILLRNSTLSDDIAFRFGDPNWSEHPLTAEKFAHWLHQHPPKTDVINLFMDYETFGIHKKPETGIFDFLASLPAQVLKSDDFTFSTASEVIEQNVPGDVYDVTKTISWEDKSNTNCVWSENMMQNNTLKKIYSIRKLVCSSIDKSALDIWGRLQAADYFYYMDPGRKNGNDPNMTPGEAFQQYTSIVADLEISLIRLELEAKRKTSTSKKLAFNILTN